MIFYYIDNDYIDILLAYDSGVQQNHGSRPYIGIVLNINGINYFAPLASPKTKYNTHSIKYFKLFDHKTPPDSLGVVKLNCMIPVPQQYLQRVQINTSTKYGMLLANQHRYIISNQDSIKKQAEKLYNLIVVKKVKGLVEKCCKYSLLEEKMAEHLQMLTDAKTEKKDVD